MRPTTTSDALAERKSASVWVGSRALGMRLGIPTNSYPCTVLAAGSRPSRPLRLRLDRRRRAHLPSPLDAPCLSRLLPLPSPHISASRRVLLDAFLGRAHEPRVLFCVCVVLKWRASNLAMQFFTRARGDGSPHAGYARPRALNSVQFSSVQLSSAQLGATAEVDTDGNGRIARLPLLGGALPR